MSFQGILKEPKSDAILHDNARAGDIDPMRWPDPMRTERGE